MNPSNKIIAVFAVIIGPNRGGKTTLIKLILNLIQPTKGQIRIFEKSACNNRNFRNSEGIKIS